MLILDLWSISFHAVIVFGLGENLLFKSILGRCVACLSALKDFTSPCFSFSWFLFSLATEAATLEAALFEAAFFLQPPACTWQQGTQAHGSLLHRLWHHRRRQRRALHRRHGGGLELLREQRRRRRRRRQPRLLSRRGRALVGGEAFVGCCWCSAIFCNICSLTMSIFILIHTC